MAEFIMFGLLKTSSVILVLLSLFSAPASGSGQNLSVVCYYNNSAQHRPSLGSYTVSNIDPFLCTHLVFGFARLEGNEIAGTEANDDLPNGLWRQFNNLKKVNPNLKTLLAVGGPNHDTGRFITMASVPASRAEFIYNLIIHLRYWKFDGVNIDWEYPGMTEKDIYTSFVQEVYTTFEIEAATFNKSKLLLSITIIPDPDLDFVEAGYDIPALDDFVDMYFVKAFDYQGPWENKTRHMSNSDDVMDIIYMLQNAASEKLHLGIALYGRTFTLENPPDDDYYLNVIDAAGPGRPGNYTQEPGLLAFYEICTLDGFMDPYFATYHNDQWITFDEYAPDEDFGESYSSFVSGANLGGLVIWTLDYDDFTGTFCNRGPNPYTYSISNTLLGTTTTTSEPTTTTTTPTTTSEPTTTTTSLPTTTLQYGPFPICPTGYGRYPHRSSCSQFIFCLASIPFLARCPANSIFNPHIEDCEDWAITNYTCVSPFCLMDFGSFPSPDGCDHFFFCTLGQATRVSCPAGAIFNPNMSDCEDSSATNYTCPGQL